MFNAVCYLCVVMKDAELEKTIHTAHARVKYILPTATLPRPLTLDRLQL